VLVDALRSPSAKASEIQAGDAIVALVSKGVRTDIRSVDQFNRVVAGLDVGQTVTLLVLRGDLQTFVPLRTLER
jgi:serine protease Do